VRPARSQRRNRSGPGRSGCRRRPGCGSDGTRRVGRWLPLAVPVTPMSYRQEEAAREILSLHPCSARCGARYRCELCGSGRCRARSSWRALFTALRTALSSPSGSLGRSAPNFPDGRRAAGGRVFSRPSGSFRHAPLPQHRRPRRPQTPDLSRPLTIPRRQLPLPLAANYRQFLTTIDSCLSAEVVVMILAWLQCNGGQKWGFPIELALRLTAEREPVGGMQDAVENRVSEGGIIEKGMPMQGG
jgi:hypothetical protein